MIGDAYKAKFSYHIDVRHLTTISGDTRLTYWLYDCLDCFKGI